MENSAIEWTHHTSNPWEGCSKVSEGCRNCYADRINTRLRGGKNWGANAPRRHPSQSYWDAPILWNRRAQKLGERHRPGDQLGRFLDWVILGGESSGSRDRAMRAEWARDIARQVKNMDRPLFFKQWGSHDETLKRVGKHAAGHELDGVTYHQFPASQV